MNRSLIKIVVVVGAVDLWKGAKNLDGAAKRRAFFSTALGDSVVEFTGMKNRVLSIVEKLVETVETCGRLGLNVDFLFINTFHRVFHRGKQFHLVLNQVTLNLIALHLPK